jgi:2-oxoglutarate decarboxylase
MTCSRMLFLGVLIGGGSLTISSQPIHAQAAGAPAKAPAAKAAPAPKAATPAKAPAAAPAAAATPGLSGWRSRGQASDYAPSSRSSLE